MSFFANIYDELDQNVNSTIEVKDKDDFLCKLCEETCSLQCDCRCHISKSCEDCDKKSCNYRQCNCHCHAIDTPDTPYEQSYSGTLQNPPKETYISQNVTPPSSAPNISSSNQNMTKTPESPSKKPKTVVVVEPEISASSFINGKSQSPEKNRSYPLLNRARSNSNNSLIQNNSKVIYQTGKEDDEDKDVHVRRYSKYSAVLLNKSDNCFEKRIFKVFKGKTRSFDKRIITFRSKSREKHQKRADEERQICLDEPGYEKKKSVPLFLKMKTQFNNNKLNDLKKPEKISDYIEEKFVRDKSEITKNFEKLARELKLENYTDKKKLAMNVFEDFEKQESWQSYTTLLFADIVEETKKQPNSNPNLRGKSETLK